MASKFSVIYPAAFWTGYADGDLDVPIVSLFHIVMYERICGYSLGHDMDFFDNFKDAKKNAPLFRQPAIIEFEVNAHNEVTKLLKITEISESKSVKEVSKKDHKTIVNRRRFTWSERAITAKDLTKGALNEFNRQFKAHESKKNGNA